MSGAMKVLSTEYLTPYVVGSLDIIETRWRAKE